MRNAEFEGKIALVTGGGSGMGEAVARQLANLGARVAVVDVNAERAAAVAESLPSATAFRCDVRQEAEVARTFDAVVAQHGRIDLVFNNAGLLGPKGALAEVSGDDFDAVFDVNARGCFLCLSAALRLMIPLRSGAIVNTASIAGQRGTPTAGLYSASKFAVIGLTRTAAREAGPHGVRVNAICPGATPTNFTAMTDASIAAIANLVPLARLASVDDMARSVLWLMSEDSAFINGVALTVDGGQTA